MVVIIYTGNTRVNLLKIISIMRMMQTNDHVLLEVEMLDERLINEI